MGNGILFQQIPKQGKKLGRRKRFWVKQDDILSVGFPYFGGQDHEHGYFKPNAQEEVLDRNIPVKYLDLNGEKVPVACVFDLLCANYGIAREGLGGDHVASPAMTRIFPIRPNGRKASPALRRRRSYRSRGHLRKMPMLPRASR
jgi:nitrate reductase alpha subunit